MCELIDLNHLKKILKDSQRVYRMILRNILPLKFIFVQKDIRFLRYEHKAKVYLWRGQQAVYHVMFCLLLGKSSC